MTKINIKTCVQELMDEITKILPIYMQNPVDSQMNNGNVSICIIDDAGNIYGKMYGDHKITQRWTYRIAWIKASQVWITGMKTGEYERLVFNNEIDESICGIETPDLLGWPGGQPVKLKDGSILSIGFSGFRGEIDLEIVIIALTNLNYL
ncbi:MAG: heme-binding protein [Paludibacter sp.]|nr:heme-binding protein [Paludibacter sp.]